jgi:hypothetical protein
MRYGFSKINIKWKFKIRIKTTLSNFARCTRFGTHSLPPLTLTCGTRCTFGPACHTHPEREREREDRPFLWTPGKQRGSPELAAPGDEDLTSVAEAAGKDRDARAHPQVASARPRVARDRLIAVTGAAGRGGSVGGACRRPMGPRKGRFEGATRRSWWCYARLRTRRLGGGGTTLAAMELGTTGYGGGAVAQLEASDSRGSSR